ncbi:thermostable hemolysin [Chitinimonas sp. BJYL2]|uniref:thermostable hemolysin n=1 Tax=Chitinimonas sp. BJYL2 TaxID=2976696 RepID=UPI0022B3E40D|nr:thermostable hemolysin [Chitinimonas sp. BJYL2]
MRLLTNPALLRMGTLGCQVEPASTPDILPFVQSRYQAVHDARVAKLLPEQFTLRTANGELLATAGFRFAQREPLFLEHYLDSPVEQAVAEHLHRPVSRGDIVELGNLAAVGGHTHTLILAMMRYLSGTPCRYVTFTLTLPVRATFRRMGLPLTTLAEARADCVPDPEAWGDYYALHPKVMVGELAAGLAALTPPAGAAANADALEECPCKQS